MMKLVSIFRKHADKLILFFAIFILMIMTPLNGDDWFFSTRHTLQPAALWEQLVIQWTTLNGRVLGNISAIFFSGLPFLRELCKTGIVFGTVMVLNRLIFPQKEMTAFPRWFFTALTSCMIYLMPRTLFRQTYNWMSGFFNYVPGTLLILIYFYLIRDHFKGKILSLPSGNLPLIFILGFAAQLFSENLTIYALCISFGLVVWYLLEHKKCHIAMIVHLLGSISGAAVMFLSPNYRRISEGQDAYRTMEFSFEGLLEIFEENYSGVVRYTFRDYSPILLLLSGCALILLSKTKRLPSLLRWLWMTAIAITPVYTWLTENVFHISVNSLDSLIFWIDAGVWLVFWCSMGFTLAVGIHCRFRQRLGLLLWTGIPLVAAPLLFVKPTGPRCFYFVYILLIHITVFLVTVFLLPMNWLLLQLIIYIPFLLLRFQY